MDAKCYLFLSDCYYGGHPCQMALGANATVASTSEAADLALTDEEREYQ